MLFITIANIKIKECDRMNSNLRYWIYILMDSKTRYILMDSKTRDSQNTLPGPQHFPVKILILHIV